jgi:GT2 family glycosyltransferase
MNVFIRPENFKEQLNAILNQTIPPKKIIVWNNNSNINVEEMIRGIPNIFTITTTQNLGVWSRFFSMYHLLSGDYVCVFDDDTIPQPKWFENCLNTINKYNSLIGTVGIVFKNNDTYSCESKSGWCFPCEDIDIVDIVGHSWFFRKEWIEIFIKELPNLDEKFLTCGEDMHLSYTLSKYAYIPTIVAPHPSNNTNIWGADKEKSIRYGNIKSTFSSTGVQKFTDALNFYKKNGFETIMYKADNIKKYSKCLDFFINKITANLIIFKV